jgi:hypothetical protein
LLSRAGKLQETEDFIAAMPFSPDVITWKTLLGACRSLNDVLRAERAFQNAVALDSQDSSLYVLMANIYAVSGMHKKAQATRELMSRRGVYKIPGVSWIEVNHQLAELNDQMKKATFQTQDMYCMTLSTKPRSICFVTTGYIPLNYYF